MRKMATLQVPKCYEKTLIIKDFASITKSAFNTKATKNGLVPQKLSVRQLVISLPYKILKLCSIDNYALAYCNNRNVYLYKDDTWKIIFTCDSIPTFAKVYVNGQWQLLVVTKNQSRIFDGTNFQNVSVPQANSYVNFEYRLFAVVDDGVMFSAPTNAIEFDNSQGAGRIYTNTTYGKVIGVFKQKDKLVLVCQKAIYYLKTSNELNDFSLIKQDVDIDVSENGACCVGNDVYLITRGELCVFNGSEIKKVQIDEDLSEYAFDGCVRSMTGAVYAIITARNDGQKKLLVHDIISQESSIFDDCIEIVDDGYYLSQDFLCAIRPTQDSVDATWESIPLDFDLANKKNLVNVSVQANGKVTVEILGRYSTQKLKLNGSEQARLNLPSYAYQIKLKYKSVVKVDNLKLTYRIREEK